MSALTRHWELKLLALGFAVVLWLFVMTSEKSDRIVSAPVEFDGMPPGLVLAPNRPDSVEVQVHALRSSLSRLRPDQIRAHVNLSGVSPGAVALRVLPEQVAVPAGVTVVRVNPSRIRVVLEAAGAARSEAAPLDP
jgi:YbbR domain-containing protein